MCEKLGHARRPRTGRPTHDGDISARNRKRVREARELPDFLQQPTQPRRDRLRFTFPESRWLRSPYISSSYRDTFYSIYTRATQQNPTQSRRLKAETGRRRGNSAQQRSLPTFLRSGDSNELLRRRRRRQLLAHPLHPRCLNIPGGEQKRM